MYCDVASSRSISGAIGQELSSFLTNSRVQNDVARRFCEAPLIAVLSETGRSLALDVLSRGARRGEGGRAPRSAANRVMRFIGSNESQWSFRTSERETEARPAPCVSAISRDTHFTAISQPLRSHFTAISHSVRLRNDTTRRHFAASSICRKPSPIHLFFGANDTHLFSHRRIP